MLNVRRFVQGTDEPIWVEILNASFRGRDDWKTITAERMLREEKERPGFDVEGRFIAELDLKPAGAVHAHVDRRMDETKGIIRFHVIPEWRGKGVEHKLLETAIGELKARGLTAAQTSVDSGDLDYVEILRNLGFRQMRVGSNMEMELAHIPHGVGENSEVAIRFLRKDKEQDIELCTRLSNETFKEHFNFRPDTVEEIRYFLFSDLYFNKYKQIFFAILDNEAVGYIGVGIDGRHNLERKLKAGEIFTIGVLKKHRRQGVGARLMLHALTVLESEGMTNARLGVDDYNPTNAMRLYEKVGFKVTKKDLFFEREL